MTFEEAKKMIDDGDDLSSFVDWDLRNEEGVPIAVFMLIVDRLPKHFDQWDQSYGPWNITIAHEAAFFNRIPDNFPQEAWDFKMSNEESTSVKHIFELYQANKI